MKWLSVSKHTLSLKYIRGVFSPVRYPILNGNELIYSLFCENTIEFQGFPSLLLFDIKRNIFEIINRVCNFSPEPQQTTP